MDENLIDNFFRTRQKTLKQLDNLPRESTVSRPSLLSESVLLPPEKVPTNIDENFIQEEAKLKFHAYLFQGKYYIPNDQLQDFHDYLIHCREQELNNYYENLNQTRDELEYKLRTDFTQYFRTKITKRPNDLYSN